MTPKYEYKKASAFDLERIWNKSIAENADDPRYPMWKALFISYNESGMAATYVVTADGEPVGEGTLLFSPECRAVRGRLYLADGKNTANINALRIGKAHEGQGHISRLLRLMEKEAAARGITALTVGVEEDEARNRAIYAHLGYTEPITEEEEDGTRVLYYQKTLKF